MIITYHGGACVKLQYGDRTILLNPPSKSSPWKPLRLGVDVALISTRHPDFEGSDSLSGKDGEEAFVVNGPGEYEIGGTFIRGFSSPAEYGGKGGINTLYLFPFEEMNVAFLGALSSSELDTAFLEAADDLDVLFVPISGNGTLNSTDAYELSVKLEPRITIPILFEGEKDPTLLQFIKEAGTSLDAVDKLTIKRKDIAELENSVSVLSSQG